MPTNFDCFAKKYWMYIWTPVPFTGSAWVGRNDKVDVNGTDIIRLYPISIRLKGLRSDLYSSPSIQYQNHIRSISVSIYLLDI
jgi:hypothetical protein